MKKHQAAAETARVLAKEGVDMARARQGSVKVWDKGGRLGQVTEADLAVERLVLEGLARGFPDDPVLAEETRQDARLPARRLWCVDPIDGTSEYVEGLQEFAVQVGLVVDGRAVAGACGLGNGDVVWGFDGGGAHVTRDGETRLIALAPMRDPALATAVHSRKHPGPRTKAALERLGIERRVPAGGVGYKVAQILLGRAHLYVHVAGGVTWWDTAAPAAVLRAAGGDACDVEGRPLRYADGVRHRDGLLFTVPGLAAPAAARLRE